MSVLTSSRPEIEEPLVGKIELNQTEPRKVEIEDYIYGECHNDHERNDMESDTACLGVGQHKSGQRGTYQPENQKNSKNLCGVCVRAAIARVVVTSII